MSSKDKILRKSISLFLNRGYQAGINSSSQKHTINDVKLSLMALISTILFPRIYEHFVSSIFNMSSSEYSDFMKRYQEWIPEKLGFNNNG